MGPCVPLPHLPLGVRRLLFRKKVQFPRSLMSFVSLSATTEVWALTFAKYLGMRMTLGLPHPVLSLLGVFPPQGFTSHTTWWPFFMPPPLIGFFWFHFYSHDLESVCVTGWFWMAYRERQGVIQGREQSTRPVQDNKDDLFSSGRWFPTFLKRYARQPGPGLLVGHCGRLRQQRLWFSIESRIIQIRDL